MTMTSRENKTVKALQNVLNSEKAMDNQSMFEYKVSTNNMRVGTIDQSEIKTLYTRKVTHKVHCGATKLTHVLYHENDKEFRHIVIKRFKESGCDINGKNQLVSEIKAWQKYALTPDADFLCPIMKFFMSKSDKVDENSEKMKDNIVIIAQKAVYVHNARMACIKAEELNEKGGYNGTDAETRYNQLKAFSRVNGWWDAVGNGGNSGVIFDYAQGCYKAVFIDYAL